MEHEGREIVVIGAGACGLMCAVQAGYLGKEVLLLEKNPRAGAKILISGGGRCNYTNLNCSVDQFVSQNVQFARSSFSQWTVDDTIQFFETYGITPQEKVLGQLFPRGNKASDILYGFEASCKNLGQEIRCNAEVTLVQQIPGLAGFLVHYLHHGKPKTVACKKVVMSSGGLPIKKMGATDFALRTARQFNIDIVPVAPALVPLVVTGKDAAWYEYLSGNTIFANVSNDHIGFEENILFTHWGLSGPAILQISSYWRPGQGIEIDLYPAGNLNDLLRKERLLNGKRQLITILTSLFTRRFAESLHSALPLEKTLAALTSGEIDATSTWFHQFKVTPAGVKGYDKAEVMRGGVNTDELYPKTLESRKVPGLYFGGECVDYTGWLGGYNFQWAWASGFVIAKNL